MKKLLTSFAVLSLFIVPLTVLAETVVRTGDTVSVAAEQVVENDFYALAGSISMSGAVDGDMYAVGGTVTANGSISEDLFVVGGTTQVHGDVADDVRVLAGEATIAEKVGGDVFVVGGVLTILSTATIEGNVYFHGAEVIIEGEVVGSVIGAADTVRIDAPIGGDVDMTTSGSLTLGDRASVGGDIRHTGRNEMTRGANAVVEGEVLEMPFAKSTEEDGRSDLVMLFVLLFASLFMYLVFKERLVSLVDDLLENPGKVSLFGLGVVLVGPILTVFLLVTILGAALGLLSAFLFMAIMAMAFILMGVMVGGLIAKVFSSKEKVNLLWIVSGVIVLQLVVLIPVLGPFVWFVLFVMTVGTVAHALYTAFK